MKSMKVLDQFADFVVGILGKTKKMGDLNSEELEHFSSILNDSQHLRYFGVPKPSKEIILPPAPEIIAKSTQPDQENEKSAKKHKTRQPKTTRNNGHGDDQAQNNG